MSVYYGYETNDKPDWTNDLSTFGMNPQVNPYFMPTDTGYVAQVERLGWLACDSVAGDNTGAKLSFVSSTDELENVGIFIYIPETKTVMQVYDLTSAYIPTGSSFKIICKIICIGLHINGNLYHYYQEIDVNSDNEIEVEMQEISDPDLTILLENL